MNLDGSVQSLYMGRCPDSVEPHGHFSVIVRKKLNCLRFGLLKRFAFLFGLLIMDPISSVLRVHPNCFCREHLWVFVRSHLQSCFLWLAQEVLSLDHHQALLLGSMILHVKKDEIERMVTDYKSLKWNCSRIPRCRS